MSSTPAWSYAARATLWALQSRADWPAEETFAPPQMLLCDYQVEARTMRDDKGDEFTSRELIWTERADIKLGDRILIGVSTAADPIAAGAREVRSVKRYADTFERKRDDFEVATT